MKKALLASKLGVGFWLLVLVSALELELESVSESESALVSAEWNRTIRTPNYRCH